MAATTGTSGFGTLLKAGNGATSETFTTIAEVRNIGGPNITLELLEATHMESPTGFREWLPSFKDGGEVPFEVNFLPANSGHKAITTDIANRTRRNFKIVWPNTAATTWSFSGYYTQFQPSAGVGDMLSASITIKITGSVTIS